MKFTQQYKAIIITFLITSVLVFGMFCIEIGKHKSLISETFYEIEPELEIQEKQNPIEEDLKKASNKAYNEDEEFKALMKNFKSLKTNNSKPTTKPSEVSIKEPQNLEKNNTKATVGVNTSGLKTKETEAYEALQKKLKKRLNNKKQADAHSKTKSTLTYSLKGRILTYYNTPRYLCEFGGKIVVNINVDSAGNVTETSINTSSTSNNQCLFDAAVAYAESTQFNTSNKANQLGTITFVFKGK